MRTVGPMNWGVNRISAHPHTNRRLFQERQRDQKSTHFLPKPKLGFTVPVSSRGVNLGGMEASRPLIRSATPGEDRIAQSGIY
jgi:hypothetical protein